MLRVCDRSGAQWIISLLKNAQTSGHWTFPSLSALDPLSFNPLYHLCLFYNTVLTEMEPSFSSSSFHERRTEDGARAESPSTEVCAYTGLLCGF